MKRRGLPYLMIGVGALALASPLALRGFDQVQQMRYARRAPHPVVARVTSHHPGLLAAPLEPEPSTGQVVGALTVPALALHTTVIQGTGDAQLLVAPGHVTTSVLPGEPGLSVIAAHNATYFHQINRLKSGDMIHVTTNQGIFTFRVTSHEIVAENQGLPDSSSPTVALEACYPLDALYFTPNRYVVFAELVKSQMTRQSLRRAVPVAAWPFRADIPLAVSSRYPLWLSQNSLPMGTLRYQGISGRLLTAFTQSDDPLNITAEAIRLLEAYRYTSEHRQATWLESVVPQATPTNDPFWGASSASFNAPIRLTLMFSPKGQPRALQIVAPNVGIDGRTLALTFSYRITGTRISLIQVAPR